MRSPHGQGTRHPQCVWLVWGSSVLLNVNFWRERNLASNLDQPMVRLQKKTDLNPYIVLFLINKVVSFILQLCTNLI
jgi:hypothetical protein